jgi:DNA-binding transcriptional LysR family regulator
MLEDRIADVAYERVDIALRFASSHAPDLVSVPMARVDWVVCAAPAYLAAAGAPREPAELEGRPCMCYWRDASDEAWILAAGDRSESVRVRSRFRANNPEAVADAAVAGLGIALLPEYICGPDLAAGRLLRILDGWTPVTRFGNRITAVAAPDRMRISRNRSFLDHLRARLG